MDLSKIQNSKTVDVIILALDSSTTSPLRIITSTSPEDFMNQRPRPKKHIENIVNKIKASNKHFAEQIPQSTQSDSETDYSIVFTIKKADPQPPKALDNNAKQ